ncbi:hypothetical protein [Bacteroides sp. An322]|uniref:hypothetical protein n=1 Tax=Bacteroides sp. An322 TaxID=1965632 RepID=UPI000B389698|nr:hypothetical protein [Bacteroides sp. An322]OUO23698.1 hypothetical protein B5F91_02325 [Bacteroides sp. An322]
MAKKNIVYRKNPSTGEIEYPVTSSAAVGMSDGSGNLDNKLSKLEDYINELQILEYEKMSDIRLIDIKSFQSSNTLAKGVVTTQSNSGIYFRFNDYIDETFKNSHVDDEYVILSVVRFNNVSADKSRLNLLFSGDLTQTIFKKSDSYAYIAYSIKASDTLQTVQFGIFNNNVGDVFEVLYLNIIPAELIYDNIYDDIFKGYGINTKGKKIEEIENSIPESTESEEQSAVTEFENLCEDVTKTDISGQVTMSSLKYVQGTLTVTNQTSGGFSYINLTDYVNIENNNKYVIIARLNVKSLSGTFTCLNTEINQTGIITVEKEVTPNGSNIVFILDIINTSGAALNAEIQVLSYIVLSAETKNYQPAYNDILEGKKPAQSSIDGSKALYFIENSIPTGNKIIKWKHCGDSLANSLYYGILSGIQDGSQSIDLQYDGYYFDTNSFGHGGGTIDAIASDILNNGNFPNNPGSYDYNRDNDIVSAMVGSNDFYRINNPKYEGYSITKLGDWEDINNFGELGASVGSETIIQRYVNLCRILQYKYPNKIICLIGIPEGDLFLDGGLSYDKTFYRSAFNECARKACMVTGVHFIDITGCGISAQNMTGYNNLYVKDTITKGYVLDENGSEVAEEGAYYTDFIQVDNNKTYRSTSFTKNVALYNANKSFIKSHIDITNTYVSHPTLAQLTEDTKYIRVSVHPGSEDVDGTVIEASENIWIADGEYATMCDRTHPEQLGWKLMLKVILKQLVQIYKSFNS